jgi:hypothetical protein
VPPLNRLRKGKERKGWADSRGERNEFGELLQWCHVTRCLARSTVEAPLDSRQVVRCHAGGLLGLAFVVGWPWGGREGRRRGGRAGVEVIEVDRHNRQNRRRQGKSDPIDAFEAARAVLAGGLSAKAKTRNGSAEAIRVPMVAKRSARQARVKALTQMRQLTFTAPDQLQSRIKGLPAPQSIAAAKGLRPTRPADPVVGGTFVRRR